MPDYPGVYIEEIGAGPVPIQGVSTDIAAFLGAAEFGPTAPTEVASFTDFQRLFGAEGPGYLAPALAGFFDNGGRRAVVARIVPAGPGPLTAADFEGAAPAEQGDEAPPTTGLAALEAPEFADVSLVYAPDASAAPGLAALLIAHCERMRYRFAVLDTPAGTDAPSAPADSRFAALYHPWIDVADGPGGGHRLVPPGGHVLGVYARVDAERGVFKAPANEDVRGAVGLAADIGEARQAELNAAGVNVLRRFAGGGVRVWGARTLSSDPEWKYVSVRRLLLYLEHSIDRGTQWAVFEPNGERLWAQVRDTVRQFLAGEWRAGALMGTTEDQAFFVRCDRTTMTQSDLDNGRLVCLVGVAPVRPAEFVIFRVGQWTADARA